MGELPVGGFQEQHLDVLREIGNIGAGNAATSLSVMLGTSVGMTVPRVRLLHIGEAVGEMGGPENMVIGTLIRLYGDIEGLMMYLIRPEFAQSVLRTLLGEESTISGPPFSELQNSALEELGNIMLSAYTGSIATLSGLNILHTVPAVSVDMVGALLSAFSAEMDALSEETLFIEDAFTGHDEEINVNLMLMPTAASLGILLRSLGIE